MEVLERRELDAINSELKEAIKQRLHHIRLDPKPVTLLASTAVRVSHIMDIWIKESTRR